MKTPKLLKGIAKKFKNRKSSKETAIQDQNVSSSVDGEKLSEDVLNERIEQQVVKATTIPDKEYSKEVHEVRKYSVINKDATHAIDKATETDTKLCEDVNKSSEGLQPTCETSEKAQDAPTETSNASNDLPLNEIKPCDAVEEKSSTKTTQQRQAILAGVVGTALLVSSVALCIMEMHVIAVIGGIIGLACVSYALYSALNPNTKLEKVENVEQLDLQNLKASGMLERP
ncbi:hypothetical protein [Wolbachia endosymbiont (group A) of Andrena hattorfiana]|uniref:hypothetical protein n=1 Tax=Wolbachia endosymbiont (group A) of Andrena hattorfiana TaxID=2953977 RepID=UPI0021F8481D|nr:hypothetical protein [Wolbachia endosymbiont (group A) of Andrena hattorfiana]